MKFSALEEYGLRCVLQMARKGEGAVVPILELSEKEGLSSAYVAKVMNLLRRGGVVRSLRGQAGGYRLARPAAEISVGEILAVMGGKLYDREFCTKHAGSLPLCVHSGDCTIRSLWSGLDALVRGLLSRCKVSDLLSNEEAMSRWMREQIAAPAAAAAGGRAGRGTL